MEYTEEQRKWIDFFKKMAQGKIAHQAKFYCIDDCMPEYQNQQKGGAVPKIQLVTPTQQQIEQAKAELKRTTVEKMIPPKRRRILKTKRRIVAQTKRKRKAKKVIKKTRKVTKAGKKRKTVKKAQKSVKRRAWQRV